jgi:glycosyltransferase involved in cell wall biosynthesis
LECQLSHVTDRDLRKKVEASKIVIIHRASFDNQIAWLEREIHNKGGILIQDLDDLIFDPDAFIYINSIDFADPLRVSLYQEDMRRNRKTLDACDFVMASTKFLAEYVHQLGKPVRIHRNAFSLEMLERSEFAYQTRKMKPDKIVIGYASGTSTHNQDFALIKPALRTILDHYPDSELWIVGPLDPGNDWGSLTNRISKHKLVPWRKLPEIQAQFDINLAPLRTDNPFGQSKSEIKYMEAALLRIPTIASPSDAFKYAIKHGDNGFLADSNEEWKQTLERLIEQPKLRSNVGETAYLDVMSRYHPAVRAQEFVETVNSMIELKFKLIPNNQNVNLSDERLLQPYWSSAKAEKSPTLLQRGLYTLRYRDFHTFLKQIWIYVRRMVVPIFPYQHH